MGAVAQLKRHNGNGVFVAAAGTVAFAVPDIRAKQNNNAVVAYFLANYGYLVNIALAIPLGFSVL